VRAPSATRLIVGFEHEADARRFQDAMRARLEEFALSLHPAKTRLIEFGRFAAVSRRRRGSDKPETFTFLGFTFICSESRQGRFLLKRKSRRDRVRAKLREVKDELRRRMHQPIPEQGRWLKQVVAGFFAYHAVPTNSSALGAFRYHVACLWRRSLRRRSQKDAFTWKRSTRPTRAPVGAACALSVDGGAIGYAATAVVALAVASWRAFHAHGIRSPTRRAG
jgi:hypothetical protein